MNYGSVTKVLGNLLLFEAAAMILPLLVALINQGPDLRAFFFSTAITGAVGLAMSRLPRASGTVKIRDALLIVALGWFLVSFFAALPFFLSSSIPSYLDAFFEAVSGLTTTGATIIDQIEGLPLGVLFWRSFLHWLGGMGILVLVLAILPMAGVGGFHVFRAESPGPTSDKLVPKLGDTAKILYTAYLGLTILQILLLRFGGMGWYDSLVHTFGTVGTGGFSTYDASIGAFDSAYLRMVVAVFMVAAGVNFALYFALYQKDWRRVVKSEELRIYLGIVITATIIVTWSLQGQFYSCLWERFQHAFFQVSSFVTTTGYGTADYSQWPPVARAVIFFLMFVGGSAGSTAGGIKVIRWLMAAKIVGHQMRKIVHPRAFIALHINGRSIPENTINSVVAFLFLYLFIIAGSTIFLMLWDKIDLESAISSAAATLGNIGPGFGVIGPGETYSNFSGPSKSLLILLMLLGRLELFTFFLLFTPSFWRQ